ALLEVRALEADRLEAAVARREDEVPREPEVRAAEAERLVVAMALDASARRLADRVELVMDERHSREPRRRPRHALVDDLLPVLPVDRAHRREPDEVGRDRALGRPAEEHVPERAEDLLLRRHAARRALAREDLELA